MERHQRASPLLLRRTGLSLLVPLALLLSAPCGVHAQVEVAVGAGGSQGQLARPEKVFELSLSTEAGSKRIVMAGREAGEDVVLEQEKLYRFDVTKISGNGIAVILNDQPTVREVSDISFSHVKYTFRNEPKGSRHSWWVNSMAAAGPSNDTYVDLVLPSGDTTHTVYYFCPLSNAAGGQMTVKGVAKPPAPKPTAEEEPATKEPAAGNAAAPSQRRGRVPRL